MPVRKATLEEWFSIYIHRKFWAQGFFVPGILDVDVTALANEYQARGQKPPYTAILVKAAAMTVAANPSVNRVVCNTIFGVRIIDLPEARVTLPVMFEHEGRVAAKLEILNGPDKMNVQQVKD